MKTTLRPHRAFRGLVALVMTLLFAVCSVLPASAMVNKSSVDNSTLKYDSAITTNHQGWLNFAEKEAEEGIVLMKNQNGALPLKKGKINLLGYCAYNPVYGGSGSGMADTTKATSIVESLEKAGFEVNPAIGKTEGYGAPSSSNAGLLSTVAAMALASFNQKEPALSNFTGDASFENMKKYSDTAVVVLGRNAGEGQDLTYYKSVDGRRYLQLSVNEEAMLKKARETFKKVVVVINSANALEMKELAAINVDAIVDVGIPGTHGFVALGKVLNGTVNPSGRLPDTWVYDNDANPTSANFGEQKAANAKGTYYVDYVEGIYNGYKYYETAAAEKAVIKDPKSGKTFDFHNYNNIVAYPFGSGLSYTTFEQKISGGVPKKLKPHDIFTIKVKVKNTGKVAGKEAVQVYVKAPYTKYDQTHGVEKAEVALVGIGKTNVLEPGKSETVKIPVNVEDFASYDSTYQNANGKKGAYRLDAGKYEFSVRANSHTAYDTKTSEAKEDFVYTGKDKRSSDDQQAYNEFDQAARGKYLSRKNGFANYAEAMNSVSANIKDLTFQNDPDAYARKNEDHKVTKHYTKGVDYDAPGNMKYTDLKGVPYDDPQWDKLVSQMSVDEMQKLICTGMYQTRNADSVGKPGTLDSDGPQGMISYAAQSGVDPVSYPAESTLAMSWNQELAYEFGQIVADELHFNSCTSWYAPAMDNHRNAYSGRNYEYYSEDGMLAGLIGSQSVLGAREKGTIVFIKHFALNDQESHRGENLHTYSNEQAIREIYLKPFEISVKKGHANAVMDGCNMVGDVWTNDYEPLNDEVLRNEWGFRGQVSADQCGWGIQYDISNYFGFTDYWLHSDAFVRGGSDFWLDIKDIQGNPLKYPSANTDADIYFLQQSCKNILYTEANAYVIPSDKDFLALLIGSAL